MKKTLVMFLIMALVVCTFGACGGEAAEQEAPAEGEGAAVETEAWEAPGSFTFVASADVGSGFDTSSRAFAQALNESGIVEQPIKIINVSGGSGAVGFADFGKNYAGRDDCLVAISGGSSSASYVNEWEYTPTDFTPVAVMITDYSACVTAADNPKFSSLEEMVSMLKDDPKSITFGGSAPPDLDYLAMVMFFMEIGIDVADINYVTYDSGGDLVPALLGHHIDASFAGVCEWASYVEAGQLLPIAVAAPERLAGVYADSPTFIEGGVNFEMSAYRGLAGPVDMPEEARAFWVEKLTAVAQSPEFQEICQGYAWEINCITDGLDVWLADYRDSCVEALKAAGIIE